MHIADGAGAVAKPCNLQRDKKAPTPQSCGAGALQLEMSDLARTLNPA